MKLILCVRIETKVLFYVHVILSNYELLTIRLASSIYFLFYFSFLFEFFWRYNFDNVILELLGLESWCFKTEHCIGMWRPPEERNWACLHPVIFFITVTNQISKMHSHKRNEWASEITTLWLNALLSSRELTEVLFWLDEQFHLIIAQETPVVWQNSSAYGSIHYSNPACSNSQRIWKAKRLHINLHNDSNL